MNKAFKERHDFIVQGLNSLRGVSCLSGFGTFYAFANVTETGMDSKTLADLLLYEAGVSCLDGGCFGEYGRGYIRFSYANSYEKLMDAVERIRKFLTK